MSDQDLLDALASVPEPRRECSRSYLGGRRYVVWHLDSPDRRYEVRVKIANGVVWAACHCQHGMMHEPATCDHSRVALIAYRERVALKDRALVLADTE